MSLRINIIVALAILSATAQANTIILDTFGPSNTYNQSAGFAVTKVPSLFQEAARFTAGASGQLAYHRSRADVGDFPRFGSCFPVWGRGGHAKHPRPNSPRICDADRRV